MKTQNALKFSIDLLMKLEGAAPAEHPLRVLCGGARTENNLRLSLLADKFVEESRPASGAKVLVL